MSKKQILPKFPTVMLIDDNEIDNFINEKMMFGYNFAQNVYVHTGSKSALEFLSNISKLKSAPAELAPKIIFLDINMPLMDGFQFLEEFEKFDLEFSSKIHVVILTSSINSVDVDKSKKHPEVKMFVHKPLTDDTLTKIVSELS